MIILKSAPELAKMRQAGLIVAEVLECLRQKVQPGVTTRELNNMVEEIISKRGATPSSLHYRGYPASLCASVNEEVVHGIPSQRKLKEGDIVSLDVGACYQGYHGDASQTLAVGQISPETQRLLRVTSEALHLGLTEVRVGNHVGDISAAIQNHVEAAGYSVVRVLCGHGIGASMHEDPEIPNYATKQKGPRLEEGMVLAIEPMVNMGKSRVFTKEDQWTVVTADGSVSAHFEHTIAITPEGPQILTMA